MIVTEEEAKEKWCPFVAVHASERSGFVYSNRGPGRKTPTSDFEVSLSCVGSKCMAWREAIYPHQVNLAAADRTPNTGFCGLAGSAKP